MIAVPIAQGTTTMTVDSNLQADIDRLSNVTGADVRLLRTDWAQLMREGVIARLHIGRWRATSRLTAEDLGLPADTDQETLDELMSLGHKRLMPAELMRQADAIEARARKLLDAAGFATYWGTFIPVTGYEDFKRKLGALQDEYMGLRHFIDLSWDTIQDDMRTAYRTAASAAFDRMARLDVNFAYDTSREDFIVGFVTRILSRIPSRDDVYDAWRFDLELGYVPLPSLLAQDQAAAAGVRVQLDIDADERRENYERDRQRRDMQWRMEQDILREANARKKELIDGFLRDIRSQLTGLIFNAAADVLASIQKHERLHPRSAVQVQNLIENVSRLNFYDDADAQAMVAHLREQIAGRTAEARDVAEIATTLKAIVTVTRQQLIDLGESPRSVRSLAMPDIADDALVTLARRELRLDVDAEVDAMPERNAVRFITP